MTCTRRHWAALMAAAPVAAQQSTTNPPIGAPAPASPAATPEQKLAKAYAGVRKTSDMLSKIEVPAAVEPAFSFKV